MNVIALKATVRERDGHKCVDCGMTRRGHLRKYGIDLDVHRKIPGEQYTLGNCETVCRRCHSRKAKLGRGEKKARHIEAGLRVALTFQVEPQLVVALEKCMRKEYRQKTAILTIALERYLEQAGLWPPADAVAQPDGLD